MSSDHQLEALLQRIADRSKPKTQEPPALRVRKPRGEYKTAGVIVCTAHDKFDFRCTPCRRVYNREWKRQNLAIKASLTINR